MLILKTHNELGLTTATALNFTRFKGIIKAFSRNVCAAHFNNFSGNLVECVDFSDLSGATVGWFISFSE